MRNYIIRTIVNKNKDKYKHEYKTKRGVLLKENEYKEYIDGLYIAPAYDNVKINKNKNDKVLSIGIDSRGRKQYSIIQIIK